MTMLKYIPAYVVHVHFEQPKCHCVILEWNDFTVRCTQQSTPIQKLVVVRG